MKKLFLLFTFVAIVATVNAQMDFGVGYSYTKFSDDFIEKIYPSLSGFELSLINRTKAEWLSLGLYFKQVKADGTPYFEGEIDENGECEIKLITWGSEVHLNITNNFSLYTKLGFLTIKESLSAYGESDSGKIKGTVAELGSKVVIPISKTFKLYVKGEYGFYSLKEASSNGELDNFTFGVGAMLSF